MLLSQLTTAQRELMLERAGHVREVLTGYRSGSAELARPGEPRPEFAPGLPLEARYAAKAAELGAGVRTVKRWVSRFRQLGEAGLAPEAGTGGGGPLGRADERCVFAVDPVTLRWLQAELTIAMDWYDRCVTGIRLTPVSTKAVDAAATSRTCP